MVEAIGGAAVIATVIIKVESQALKNTQQNACLFLEICSQDSKLEKLQAEVLEQRSEMPLGIKEFPGSKLFEQFMRVSTNFKRLELTFVMVLQQPNLFISLHSKQVLANLLALSTVAN